MGGNKGTDGPKEVQGQVYWQSENGSYREGSVCGQSIKSFRLSVWKLFLQMTGFRKGLWVVGG